MSLDNNDTQVLATIGELLALTVDNRSIIKPADQAVKSQVDQIGEQLENLITLNLTKKAKAEVLDQQTTARLLLVASLVASDPRLKAVAATTLSVHQHLRQILGLTSNIDLQV